MELVELVLFGEDAAEATTKDRTGRWQTEITHGR